MSFWFVFFFAIYSVLFFFFFQAEDGIRDFHVTGVQTCALPILIPTTPPESAIARSWSSERLRGWCAIARHDECEASTGSAAVASTSQNVASETCDTSISSPSSFIRRTTRLPNSLSPPLFRGSVEDPAQSLPLFHVSV